MDRYEASSGVIMKARDNIVDLSQVNDRLELLMVHTQFPGSRHPGSSFVVILEILVSLVRVL